VDLFHLYFSFCVDPYANVHEFLAAYGGKIEEILRKMGLPAQIDRGPAPRAPISVAWALAAHCVQGRSAKPDRVRIAVKAGTSEH
jgi:hypothetical protein